MEAIDNPRLGLALDTGCLHYQRIQLTEALLVGGERVHHVRLRDATRTDFNRPIGEGEVNFAASVKQLRQHGYAGAISLSVSDPQSVAQSVSRIQPLLASGETPVAADPETEPEPEE
jgi:sugar phosphate isomerase/epimerase